MIGNNTATQQKYIKDHNNQNIYEDKGKEKLFRKYWSKVFVISPEENGEFDQVTDERVNREIEINQNKLISYPTVNLVRLQAQTNLVTVPELKTILKSLKQRAPGEDKITKYHLDNLPNKMLINFMKIINAVLSTGHFPSVWKTSIMIFIPKANKFPLQHINYRPISLLSVPGKIAEKIVNNRLMNTLTQLQLHNEHQHGF
ncbi:RNA-directed DNA polymerase from mobile element jockey, partial [Dictyocoela roeselum]